MRMVFALIVGGLIGIEREIKGKPAGMRTNMLMCMGTCVLMILSIEVFSQGAGLGDPSRMASQVMTGIGFLGAGMIIQSRFSVIGLTSAATLWFVAAIGLVIGWGDYLLASASTILIILTLTLLSSIEQRVAVRMRRHILQFRFSIEANAMKPAKKVFATYRINPENLELRRGDTKIVVDVEYVASDDKHGRVVQAMRDIEGVEVRLEF